VMKHSTKGSYDILRYDEKISLANLSACFVVDFVFAAASSFRASLRWKTIKHDGQSRVFGLFCCFAPFWNSWGIVLLLLLLFSFFCRESFRNFLCSSAVVLLCFPFLPIFPLRHNKKKTSNYTEQKKSRLATSSPPSCKAY
jgi:hypothetical protein